MESKLAKEVLSWWEEHQSDSFGGEEEIPIYDEEPEFVSLAMEITQKTERKTK